MLPALFTGLTLVAAVGDAVATGGDGSSLPAVVPDGDDERQDGDGDSDDKSDDGADRSDRDDGDADGEKQHEHEHAAPRALPRPDGDERARGDGDGSSVFLDSSIGCGVGGALPALGTTAGLGLFYGSLLGGNACGSVAGFVGGVSGALVAIPSVLLLGPCAAGGATCGAALGAALSDKDIGRAVQWSLPGLGAGLVGGGVATAGLLVSSTTNPELRDWAMPVGTTLVVVGTLLASAGGPLSVAGATLMQSDSVDDDDDPAKAPKKALRDGGIEARATPRARAHGEVVDVAMAW